MGEAKRRKQKDPTWGQEATKLKKLIHLGNSTHISLEQLQSPEIKEILAGLVPEVSVSEMDLNYVFIGHLEKAGKSLCIPVSLPVDKPMSRIYARCRYQDGWGKRTEKDGERYVQIVLQAIHEYIGLDQEIAQKTFLWQEAS